MKKFFIYGLFNPAKPDDIRYVGAASHKGRPEEHTKEAAWYPKRHTHKLAWIRSIGAIGWRVLAEYESWEETLIGEKTIIAAMRANGVDLTNGTGGGEGVFNPTKEVREKCGAAISAAHLRPEARAHRSKITKARLRDPEAKARLIAVLNSPLARANRKAANARPDVRAKISEANKIAWAKPEVRAKHVAGITAAWARRRNTA